METAEVMDETMQREANRTTMASWKMTLNPFIPTSVYHHAGDLFVRESYPMFYDYVHQGLDAGYMMISVTGTPGIGKSCFYSYFFDRFRAANRGTTIITASFNMQRKQESCKVFSPGSIEGVEISDIPRSPDALYLFDGAPDVVPRGHRMVCFTSPNQSWLTTSAKDPKHLRLIMPPWSLEELLDAAEVLSLPLDPRAIESRFREFGGSARYCLTLNNDQRFLPMGTSIRVQKILSISSIQQILMNLDVRQQTEGLSHLLFHWLPVYGGVPYLPCYRELVIASELIEEDLEMAILISSEFQIEEFLKQLQATPDASTLVGCLFEIHAVKLFLRGEGTFNLSPLLNASEEISLDLTTGVFERMRRRNFPAVDGVFRDASTGMVYLLQMTRANQHAVKGSGLWQYLRGSNQLHLLERRKVILVFVVPVNRMDFGSQAITIPNLTLGPDTPVGQIHGIGPIGEAKLQAMGILTAEQLRSQPENRIELNRYLSSLNTFEEWCNSAHHFEALKRIPQYRMVIAKEF